MLHHSIIEEIQWTCMGKFEGMAIRDAGPSHVPLSWKASGSLSVRTHTIYLWLFRLLCVSWSKYFVVNINTTYPNHADISYIIIRTRKTSPCHFILPVKDQVYLKRLRLILYRSYLVIISMSNPMSRLICWICPFKAGLLHVIYVLYKVW